jgi:hypothetical protein
VVGLQYTGFTVEDITLIGDNTVQGLQGIGGVVGTSFDTVKGCTAVADIVVLGDDGACAGVLAGGTDGGSLIDCTATGGTVTATGDACWALGGLSGTVYAGEEVTNCHAEGVTITASGADDRLVGGLLGFTGTYGEEASTLVTGCSANVTIVVSAGTNRVGGLVGGSSESSTQTIPSSFIIRDCSTAGTIAGGSQSVGSIAGYAYDSTVENCSSIMTWDGGTLEQVGLIESALMESRPMETMLEGSDLEGSDQEEPVNGEPDNGGIDTEESDNAEPGNGGIDMEESDNAEPGNGGIDMEESGNGESDNGGIDTEESGNAEPGNGEFDKEESDRMDSGNGDDLAA